MPAAAAASSDARTMTREICSMVTGDYDAGTEVPALRTVSAGAVAAPRTVPACAVQALTTIDLAVARSVEASASASGAALRAVIPCLALAAPTPSAYRFQAMTT